MPIVGPSETVSSKTFVIVVRGKDHVIKILNRRGGRGPDTEFLRGQKDGVEISYHTPGKSGLGRVSEMVPDVPSFSIVCGAIDTSNYSKGGILGINKFNRNMLV